MTTKTEQRVAEYSQTWNSFVRGDVHRLRATRSARGHEQRGERYGVTVQSDDLMLSTVLVAPTSRSAPQGIFRPTILVGDEHTQVLVEQTSAVVPERLGEFVGRLTHDEMAAVDQALRLVLELG
jgi:mRNA interferase MazF